MLPALAHVPPCHVKASFELVVEEISEVMCVFEIRVLLNSILSMGIIFNQLQSTGTRLRPPPGTQVWRTTPHNCSLM